MKNDLLFLLILLFDRWWSKKKNEEIGLVVQTQIQIDQYL